MSLYYSPHFVRRLKKRLEKNPLLREKFAKQVTLFQENPRHPSLRLHKLKGKRINQHSFWIEGDLRVTFISDADDVIFTDILTHDEY